MNRTQLRRDLPTNNKMRALSEAQNLRMSAETQNGEMVAEIHPPPDNPEPRRQPLESSRSQGDKRRAGANLPEARCFDRVSIERCITGRKWNPVAAPSTALVNFSARELANPRSAPRFQQLA